MGFRGRRDTKKRIVPNARRPPEEEVCAKQSSGQQGCGLADLEEDKRVEDSGGVEASTDETHVVEVREDAQDTSEKKIIEGGS
ncbi:hypothetical protein DPEC_G00142970 [Dallia pectoralis]|uniref:Uncharacterized protein n=1 Tax=Dallia pectoralis TaxID=75939 RepID=A0ACC2GMU2_DALPE|nr:hypothetical protein DPEC_G00142970 [Dallia pectoralis]